MNEFLDDELITESVARVQPRVFNRLSPHPTPRRRRLSWAALSAAALMVFGGGLVAGAAYASTRPQPPAIPAGLLRVDCTGILSQTAGAHQYFDTSTNTLPSAPGVTLQADVKADPDVVCTGGVPGLLAAFEKELPTLANTGRYCGTIQVPGYPKAWYVSPNPKLTMNSTNGGEHYSATTSFISSSYPWPAAIAGATCDNTITLPPLQPTPGSLVTCEAAPNHAVVYLDTTNIGAAALCAANSYSPWKS
ncbi:hypothetical protein ACFOYW_00520 [Gryllotalpicola reticulitermitis]|uniref:Ig-like domain-containing protein n=1 Tax=Gryllotalpicola reticulitermitis TaxID=1184153 RepID=A0ABV8Q407_9MICO